MDKKTVIRMASGFAVTIGVALMILWLSTGGPLEIVGVGVGLTLGGCSAMLTHLGIIESDADGDSADGSGGGDGGD